MKRFLSLTLCLSLMVVAGSAFAATKADTPRGDDSNLRVTIPSENVVLHSNTSNANLRFKEAAGPDTFALYGYVDGYSGPAPDPQEGRFQDANGVVPDQQGWYTVDRTDLPVFWQITDQVNAENLGPDAAPGDNVAWCGQTAAQEPGWGNTPGYGNGWNDILEYKKTVSNTAAGQTVGLEFYFNHDTEPGFDFFNVAYDSAGSFKQVYSIDSSNKDASNVFQPPGVQYSTTSAQDIVFSGGDYGGDANDEIIIQMSVTSDGSWSDSDGLWPTDGGAAQVDDITVNSSEGTDVENFESGFSFWAPAKANFVGDFAEVRPRLNDIDPCNDNLTPLFTFVDDGDPVNNAASSALIPGYPTETDGETSINWDYGVPGGWVVNYNGGLSEGELAIHNEIWSPEIDWDIAGTMLDNDPEVSGAYIVFDQWSHMPINNNMFYVWHVRSTLDGVAWTDWQDRGFVYYGGEVPVYARRLFDVTDLLLNSPLKVQFAIGVRDMSNAGGFFAQFPGDDGTPGPAYDNAAMVKYRIGGPSFNWRNIDLANDGFPAGGSIDAATQKNDLDVPFDMAQDIRTATDPVNEPGDSIVADIVAVIPGSEITDMRMFWALKKNTFFDDVRTPPGRGKDENVDTSDPDMWFGEVVHDSSKVSSGAIVEDKYFFDLPDVDFLYPGDVLYYYLQADDNFGNTTTAPANTAGFGTGAYNRTFTVRALPTIFDAAGAQPPKLIYNDFGRRGGENDWVNAMGQLGLVEGVDYDSYTTMGPSSAVSNGIGSAGAHGANADQLDGYETIVYLGGNLSNFYMSDGSATGNNDKSNDLGTMSDWHDLPGKRTAAYFGDYLFSALTGESSAGDTYVQTILGADFVDNDVRNDIDDQTTPRVRQVNPAFATEFIAYGGCATINQFDQVEALPVATRGHGFVDLTNGIYADIAASVIHDRDVSGDRKVDMSFPYALLYVYSASNKDDANTGARTELLREIFDFFGVDSGGPNVVSAPAAKAVEMAVYPNPFNPTTTVKFANLPKQAEGSVKVFNLRGELVTTLHAGEFGDKSQFVWNGTDNNGASVASGVYMIEGQADGFRQVIKVALVK